MLLHPYDGRLINVQMVVRRSRPHPQLQRAARGDREQACDAPSFRTDVQDRAIRKHSLAVKHGSPEHGNSAMLTAVHLHIGLHSWFLPWSETQASSALAATICPMGQSLVSTRSKRLRGAYLSPPSETQTLFSRNAWRHL